MKRLWKTLKLQEIRKAFDMWNELNTKSVIYKEKGTILEKSNLKMTKESKILSCIMSTQNINIFENKLLNRKMLLQCKWNVKGLKRITKHVLKFLNKHFGYTYIAI